MKRILSSKKLFIILVSYAFACCFGVYVIAENKALDTGPTSVAMVIPVAIDAFAQLEKGCRESIGNAAKLTLRSAEGDPSKFETVIKGSLIEKPDFLVTVGTQLTNTALGSQFKENLPILIATAITDPSLVSGLKTIGLDPPRKLSVAIISDRPVEDIFKQMATLIRQLKQSVNKVGILYNPSEINSKATAEGVKTALNQEGIVVKMGALTTSDDVSKATKVLLLAGAELIVIPHDKYAVEKAATVVQLCNATHIPVLSLDDGTVRKSGVLAAVSVNYRMIGQEVGNTIVRILHGMIKAENLPIKYFERASIYINEAAARNIGLVLPDSLRKQAILIK